MDKNLQRLYETHHLGKKEGFAIWRKERGKTFSKWIGQGKDVLDLGCRDGTLTRYFVKGNRVTGIDIDRRMLVKCRKELGIQTFVLNLYDPWPFSANSFDVVVMGEVLEHLFAPQEIINKVKSVLTQKGTLIGSVPNFYHLKRRILFALGLPVDVFEDQTHITVFGVKKLRRLLETQFREVQIIGLGRKSHSLIMPRYMGLLAHSLLFKASLPK